MLKTYLIIFFLWTAYRIFFHLPEWFDEFVAKPIIWLLPLFFLGKFTYSSLGKIKKVNISYSIFLGLSIGFLYFFLYRFLFVSRFGLPIFNPTHFSLGKIVLQFCIALSTGFIEEIVFRKYILEEGILFFNDRIIANIFATILFVCIHLPIIIFVYHYSLMETVSYLCLLTLTGIVYGFVYLHKKSLISSSVTHAVWNFLGTMIQ
jgi:membrane protease YdiL (CAAX protease family)